MGLSPDWKGSCCPTAISSVLIRTEVLNQSSYKQHNLIVNCCFRSSEHLKYSVWAVPKYGKCFLFFFVICALWKQLQVTLIKAWNCTRQLAVCYVVMNYFLAFLLVVLKCTSLFHERHFHMSRQEKHRFNKNINDDWVPFSCFVFRVLVSCTLAQCHTITWFTEARIEKKAFFNIISDTCAFPTITSQKSLLWKRCYVAGRWCFALTSDWIIKIKNTAVDHHCSVEAFFTCVTNNFNHSSIPFSSNSSRALMLCMWTQLRLLIELSFSVHFMPLL